MESLFVLALCFCTALVKLSVAKTGAIDNAAAVSTNVASAGASVGSGETSTATVNTPLFDPAAGKPSPVANAPVPDSGDPCGSWRHDRYNMYSRYDSMRHGGYDRPSSGAISSDWHSWRRWLVPGCSECPRETICFSRTPKEALCLPRNSGNGGDGNGCYGPPDVGTCYAALLRWFYDFRTNTCRPFYWGGCGGNRNRYDTPQACRRACVILIGTQGRHFGWIGK